MWGDIAFWVIEATGGTYLVMGFKYRTARPIKAIRAKRANRVPSGIDNAIAASQMDSVKVGPSKELALPEDVKIPPVYEQYDHPAPPIPLLAASLPSAPTGFGWEITTAEGPNGNPHLRLGLLNLATGLEVEAIQADLVIVRRWKYAEDETYAQFYRRAERRQKTTVAGWTRHPDDFYSITRKPVYNDSREEIDKAKGKVMVGNLITPMVDWASILTLRYIASHPDEAKTHYMLIEAPNKEEALV